MFTIHTIPYEYCQNWILIDSDNPARQRTSPGNPSKTSEVPADDLHIRTWKKNFRPPFLTWRQHPNCGRWWISYTYAPYTTLPIWQIRKLKSTINITIWWSWMKYSIIIVELPLSEQIIVVIWTNGKSGMYNIQLSFELFLNRLFKFNSEAV